MFNVFCDNFRYNIFPKPLMRDPLEAYMVHHAACAQSTVCQCVPRYFNNGGIQRFYAEVVPT